LTQGEDAVEDLLEPSAEKRSWYAECSKWV
jgi:hypothetical protein